MTIEITPNSPVVVTETISTTFTTFLCTGVFFDLAEGKVELTVDKTDSSGIITTDTIVLTGTDFANYVNTVAQSGDTVNTLGITASTAAIKNHYGINS